MKLKNWIARSICVVLIAAGGMIGLAACDLSNSLLSSFAAKTRPDTRLTLQASQCLPGADVGLITKTQEIVQRRLSGLGIANAKVEVQDACHLVIDLTAPANPTQMLDLVIHTGRLEFVDTGMESYPKGAILRTTGNPTPTLSASNPQDPSIPEKVYATIMTGADFVPGELKALLGGVNSQQAEVAFQLEPAVAQRFKEFTTQAAEKQSYLCIVLDNVVQSCPSVNSPIPSGKGVITVGQGGIDEANQLVNLLRYGSLPYTLEVIRTESLPSESESKP